MTYLKINKANLSDSVTKAEQTKQKLSDAETALNNFVSSAKTHCSNWENNYWYKFKGMTGVNENDFRGGTTENPTFNKAGYDAAVEAAARQIVRQKVDTYKSYTTDMAKVVHENYTLINNIFTAFNKVQNYLNEYEANTVDSLDEYFKASFDKHDLDYEDFNYKFEFETDEEGNEIPKLLVEILGNYENLDETAVEAVTNAGTKAAAPFVMLYNLFNDDDFLNMTPEQQRQVAEQTIQEAEDAADDQTKSYKKRGWFSTTDADEIADRYEKDTGVKYDKDRVHKEADYFREKAGYDEDDDFGLGKTAAPFITGLGVYNFGKKNGPAKDEDLEEDGLGYLKRGRDNVVNGDNLDEDGNVDKDKLIEPEPGEGPKTKDKEDPEEAAPDDDNELGNEDTGSTSGETGGGTGGGSSGGGGGGNNGGGGGGSNPNPKPEPEPNPEPNPSPDPGPEEIIPDDRTTELIEDPIPKNPEVEPQYDNATIDRLAEEEYYNRYTPEELADYRNEQMEEFEDLYVQEDKSELIDFLTDSGYELSDAQVIAENKELSLAAFLAAKQSADMADISKSIAQGANMDMTKFDTRYDDAPSYKDLVSGETSASLSNPNNDPNVANARQNMNNAKTQYDRAVDTANKSIEAANDNKTKLDNVRKSIIKKSGNDSSKWSEEDIKKYNDAVKDYNDSVRQANDDVASAQEAKETYENTKETYENSRETYYDRVKEDLQANKDVNDNGGEIPESTDTPQDGEGKTDVEVKDDGIGLPDEQGGTEVSDKGIGLPDESAGTEVRDDGIGLPDEIVDDSQSNFISVDESGTGIGIRGVNTENADSIFVNENNEEYIYHESDGQVNVSNNGIGV